MRPYASVNVRDFYCEDVKLEALAFVLHDGRCQVLLDHCSLIWDSPEDLTDPTGYENEIACLGVGGLMIDEYGLKHQFSICWLIDREIHEEYLVCANRFSHVNGERNYQSEDLQIYSSKSCDNAVLRKEHEYAIRELTNRVKRLGAKEAIRLFMTSWIPPTARVNGL